MSGAFESSQYTDRQNAIHRLRISLALNRGIEELTNISREAADGSGSLKPIRSKKDAQDSLQSLFVRIHKNVFQDWNISDSTKPGQLKDRDALEAVRENIKTVLCTGGATGEKGAPLRGLFDDSGFVVHQDTESLSETLAEFYIKMRHAKPFTFGNELTLDMFMVALGKLPSFKSVFQGGIDLRRLDANAIEALHSSDNPEAVSYAFEQALDSGRTPALKNKANGYGVWERHEAYVSGVPFLTHEYEGKECLVTVNGGLIPKTDALESQLHKHLEQGKLLADFPAIQVSEVVGYMPGTEALRANGKHDIDGIEIKNGAAPLFCLGQNILTGLGPIPQKRLIALLHDVAGKGTQLFALANNEALRDKMLSTAKGDTRLESIVEVAYKHLSRITHKLDREKDDIFRGKTPVDRPKLFLSMGGAGAGKSVVEQMAHAQCGDNLVVASLDDFRSRSDLYTLLMAANHHGDDYITVEPFANSLRTWVADAAREGHINTMYDGTGISYQPRYAGVVDAFKKDGFMTNVTAVDAPLVVPKGREAEFDSSVIGRVKERQAKVGRALPWSVVVEKHIMTARSLIQAAKHDGLDKLSLFANDRGPGKHYLVAESFIMNDDQLYELQRAEKTGRLDKKLRDLALNGEGAALPALTGGKEKTAHELLKRNDEMNEDNVSFLSFPENGKNRVIAVYNSKRFVDLMEKGLMNNRASSPENLIHKREELAFHAKAPINRFAPWKLRLQGSDDISEPSR